MQITITLSVEELLIMPGDAVIRILNKVLPPEEFLKACIDHEFRKDHGKGRWVILNHIRQMISHPPKRPCAACDRGDFQLGHADTCPKAQA